MMHLVRLDGTSMVIYSFVDNGNNRFTVTVDLCSLQNGGKCILFDDGNGSNRTGQMALAEAVRLGQTGRMDIDLVLTDAPVAITSIPASAP